jgi:hypothetical protein
MSGLELGARTAVVTGAGSAMGRAIAIALASAGATVYEAGPDGAEEMAGLVRDLLAREGGIDLLVHTEDTSSQAGRAEVTEALLPGLSASNGQLVFVGSTLALTATTALTALRNSLRGAIDRHGVRVINVYAPARPQQPEDVASVVLGALTPA